MMCGKCPQRGHQGCEIPRTSLREFAIVSSLVCLGLASCATYRVNSFAADKTLVCPGESTTIRWEVQGPARLRADRGANDWDEQDVPSTGERSFSEIAKTTFTITDHTSIQQLMVDRFGTPGDLAYFGDAVARKNNRVGSLAQTLSADVPDGSVLTLPAAPTIAGGWATSPALTDLAKLFRKAIAAFRSSKNS